jgi:leader peptidase (prepilin peptidase)/N-methyltransferase
MGLLQIPVVTNVAEFFLWAAFAIVLALIAYTDWKTRIIPNAFVVALVVIRVVALVVNEVCWPGGEVLLGFIHSLIVAIVFSALMLLLKYALEQRLGKECLGLGDVKLVAAGCLYLSFDQALCALFIAAVAGVALALYFRFAKNSPTFPFAPALCLGIFLGALA